MSLRAAACNNAGMSNHAAKRAREIFGREKALIGMVHTDALPGTPFSTRSVREIAQRAAGEAEMLAGEGFDALLIENMHDRPYLKGNAGPEIVAAMTRIGLEVRSAVGEKMRLGVQILAAANAQSLAVALAIEARFVRAEGFCFAAVADEGLLADAEAGPLLRYRKVIGAEGIAILSDIDKKHSAHAITADIDLAMMAETAEFFGADGVIVTGAATGKPTSTDDLKVARKACDLPVIVGSGAKPETLKDLWGSAEGIIIGSWYKRGGVWDAPADRGRVRALMKAAEAARR